MSSEDPPSSDLSTLSSLIFSISLPLLSAEPHKDLLYKAIHEEKIRILLKGFMLDSQTKRIIITKVLSEENEQAPPNFEIKNEISLIDFKNPSICFLKRSATLIAKKDAENENKESTNFMNQLQVLNIGYLGHDNSPFGTSQNYIHNGLLNMFDAYKVSIQKKPSSEQDSYNLLLKRIAECNLALLHCQQSIEVPEIQLAFEPAIKAKVQAAKEENRKASTNDLIDLINDNNFVNSLVNCVAKWIQEINAITKTKHDIKSGNTLQEVNYWISFERSLAHIDQQVKTPEVELTLDVLRFKKKYQVTTPFENDLNLKGMLAKCNKISQFLKDFPINELLSSNTLKDINNALNLLFLHLKKNYTNEAFYEPQRFINFLEVISKDLLYQMLKILVNVRLMQINYTEFSQIVDKSKEIFAKWDEEFSLIKDMLKKNKVTVNDLTNLYFEHNLLKSRLERVREIRQHHEKLREVIEGILQKENNAKSVDTVAFLTTKDISEAYTQFLALDILDLSKEGDSSLNFAYKNYEMKIDRVENHITVKLRDKLGAASNANEMFRIFSKFNALFFRPSIKGAIHEYQSQLLRTVQNDIQNLRDKFIRSYENTQNSKLSAVRDIPGTSGAVIWAKQINRKLKKYMERVENVLGADWSEHPEGKQLKDTGETFEKHLNTQSMCDNWYKSIQEFMKNNSWNHKIFEIVQKKKLEIVVNYDERMINLFKEIRNFLWMKIRINISITFAADDVKLFYPYAVSLQESIHTFNQITAKIDDKFGKLVASHRKEVLNCIQQGLQYAWNYKSQLSSFVKKLSERVIALEEAVQVLSKTTEQIHAILGSLAICEPEYGVLLQKINQIQEFIDDFNFKEYSNLHLWVPELDAKIENVLCKRLEEIIIKFVNEFIGWRTSEKNLIPEPTIHELKIQNQVLYIDPPIEYARFFWLQAFHRQLGITCTLPRLEANRYGNMKDLSKEQTKKDNTYSTILRRIPNDVLLGAYQKINKCIEDSEKYVKTWLNYQSLWEIDPRKIYERLGENIENWHQLLEEIKKGRSTFDNSETEAYFGAILIDYRLVQAKINNKYDAWHKEILNQFGSTYGERVRVFYSQISNCRVKLEKINFTSSSSDLIQSIMEMQEIKKKHFGWGTEIETFRSSQKLLDRQRFNPPSDWLWLEQVEGEWSAFKQIFSRKNGQMDAEIPNLQSRIITEEQMLEDKIKEIEEMWKTQRPHSGDLLPGQALEILVQIETKLKNVKDNYARVCKAKDLLNLEPGNPNKLEALEEDISGLKEVWTELKNSWSVVDSLKDSTLNAIVPKKLKQSFDESFEKLNSFPARLRQYEAWEKMKNRLTNYKKMNALIMELKNEAMKARHWKTLLSKMKLNVSVGELTLMTLWSCDLLKYENHIKDVMTVARGELVLEEMLRNIKEYWNKFELDLVRYQNKCKLIKGWDELFTKVDEDLNNLSSMKISPYYKSFEEEISPWDQKLQNVRITFDIWIDVQRRWVYLEGIFFGASDIKTQLTNEYNRFKGIDNEFTSLMKKVSNKPSILEVISLPNLQKSLERLADLLAKIQKALGDYLETQRSAFARFYFVGDEDLLEIIGNSKDVTNVQRHFPKMYAGITTVISEDSGDLITGMNSREGEQVSFEKSIRISEDPSINIWLSKIEDAMRTSLASNLERSLKELSSLDKQNDQSALEVVSRYPAQMVLLALQTLWCSKIENSFEEGNEVGLSKVENYVLDFLTILAESVLKDLKKDLRQKYEQIITDFVHQRDVTRLLIRQKVTSPRDFAWQYHMRFSWIVKESEILKKLHIQMSNASFHYGFEYLGIGEKLVQTPLTDKCYLTLTQALHLRMGGSPFGPAGTGKTESVKALGCQLGRFVLVFNCDETFDFHAMGRIFVGLCQVGAWGCFDEFNRLEERMLSAVSQQILTIQTGLREKQNKIDLMGKEVRLNINMGIFVTMNPGYAGRSNLPENLKQLFRQMAMVKPDRELIAQVMLYSQGYRTAERLAGKIVSLFELCNDQLSSQPHYDFGLRALKSVLVSAGNMKRQEKFENIERESDLIELEQKILLRSVCETLVPKLIAEDIPLLSNLLSGVFPGSEIPPIQEEKLREAITKICVHFNLLPTASFMEKVLQLNQILKLHHGVMMVGPSGCGKSAAWKVLIESLYRVDKIKGEAYVIDPKAISKDELYGKLDSTTLEWTDGVFTGVLRRITENVRGESGKRHWIIFDGDVDPEWAENLNSVLDDNKLLTLPNGERISIPPNVKIMFEVETLKYATLATVSRCGMVWFSEEIVNFQMNFYHYLNRLKQDDYDLVGKLEDNDEESTSKAKGKETQSKVISPESVIRAKCVSFIEGIFDGDESLAQRMIQTAENMKHVMDFTRIRVIEAFFALIRKAITNVLEYNETHSDFPLEDHVISRYMKRQTVLALMWGISGSMKLALRAEFSRKIATFCDIELPPLENYSLIDYEVKIEDGEWSLWKKKVPLVDIDPQKVTDADLIITTVDTLRHQDVLCSWLSEHRPFLLCGPPGSGKTMTLMSTLKSLPDFEMIFVNFSSSTSPGLIMKQFEHYCEYKKTPSGILLTPKQPNKWLVVFCDEINLPDMDKYGTQSIITFLRQLTEQRGFWRPTDKTWISLEKIQFVGACNPPTDVGRHPLSNRFLRHCPLILVDFPGAESLKQIYGTFNRAMLKKVPQLRSFADSLTDAMVEFYMKSQIRFTADIQPHYIYSPRELTRWKYAINEAVEPLESLEDLVRLWAHEALRLFQDRLVQPEEKEWCDKLVDEVAQNCFPSCKNTALERPILFTTYLSKNYITVELEPLRNYVQARLKVFYEEELNVPIVVFDSVLEHILRIDRVLRQPLGHLLLVGSSGVGKTTLSRFVSWMNNLSVFQIKAGRNYSLVDFDNDLREVMKRAGVKQEKICFIFDESNVLSVAFLERMNALLASGEVPGLFEGEEYMSLMNQCKESALKDNKMVDSDDQLYKNFITSVQRNLHVVFTMNPANPDFSNRTASSPALFNRCVIDWFGDWSQDALWQVAREFTLIIDPPEESFTKQQFKESIEARHDAIVNSIVYIHNSVIEINKKLRKAAKKFNFLTPRDFLDFIKHFIELHKEKKEQLEEQQFHLNQGLSKLKETEETVSEMQKSLDKYKKELEVKEKEANDKLNLMVQKQREAEQKKDSSIILSKDLEIKQAYIQEKTKLVEADLAEALPALQEAQKSVAQIKPQNLVELKGMANPPAAVKLTLESVLCVVNNKMKQWTWAEVRTEVGRQGFINNVINFKTDDLSASAKEAIKQTFLTKPEWDTKSIMRASQAAGPLALWVESQLKFADILKSIQPKRDEIASLRKEEESLVSESNKLQELIIDLQKKIQAYQQDYAILITEVEKIKSEMNKVKDKVSRSIALITNLSSERIRWEASSKNFKEQMATMPGDVLISGAFLAYIGFFDHFYRKVMLHNWREYLESAGINFRNEMSLIEFLSKASDRLNWQTHHLPSDDLCTENAIILSNFHRYPLILDPAGQALEFIISFYKEKKIARTSFADDSFMKNLETALRFGCPLLVQDVEKIDPILNSVLNKELHKTGGRILIRVGDQEIDFSASFSMFMITRDSNAKFTPDLCSRVTFVNFTVTPSSLENQCLNIYLKNERPDVEEKRINLLKLQGEYVVKLRGLEDSLLDALSNVKGNILDNEEVISKLEKLKSEAGSITEQMEQSHKIMNEVRNVTDAYLPLAVATSKVYFSLVGMSSIHYLYEYSLQFFMNIIFDLISKNEKLTKIGKNEVDKRLTIIFDELFIEIYKRISNSLISQDKHIVALKLVQIKLGKEFADDLYNLIKTPTILESTLSPYLLNSKLSTSQLKLLEELSQKTAFSNLLTHIDQNQSTWLNFLSIPNPEDNIPNGWQILDSSIAPNKKETFLIILNLTIMRIFRPDKFLLAASRMINKILGEHFMEEIPIDMKNLVEKESNSYSPILLCSAPGFDASYKVDSLAKDLNKKYISVAIGSAEGFDLAEKAINQAAKTGSWVLLKNVHLAPSWLNEIEKKIHRLTPHDNFRLFLAMEFNPKVPSTLIRQSYKLVFEPPDGIKASLQRSYKQVFTQARSDRAPTERARLHFLLAWTHAVILERLRYTPIGWTKVYEFNEADQRCALDLIDEFVDQMGERTNISPEKLPWDALRTILTQNLYGGKIDNEYDHKILASLVERYFTPKSFDPTYSLFESPGGESVLTVPEALKTTQYMDWIEKLPIKESPAWSGLPMTVEKVEKEGHAIRVLSKLWEMQDVNEEEITLEVPAMIGRDKGKTSDKKGKEGGQQVQWLRVLGERSHRYLGILPGGLDRLNRTEKSIGDPLFRFLEREVTVAATLLEKIRGNLFDLKGMCEGVTTSTNVIKSLAIDIHNDIIPALWKKYNCLKMPVNDWILDLKKRLDQFNRLISEKEYQKKGVWMGGLLFPEAYLTATRQFVAQNNKWSLEELELYIELYKNQEVGNDSFLITGMNIEGAEWDVKSQKLALNEEINLSLPTLMFSWKKVEKAKQQNLDNDQILTPVYLNKARSNLLFSVKMNMGDLSKTILYQKGIALIAWNN